MRKEELKEELAEAKRTCSKYLGQILDEQEKEKSRAEKFFSQEEVECIKQLAQVAKQNALRDAEHMFDQKKGAFGGKSRFVGTKDRVT